jgi:hypothetical protein
VGIEAPKAGKRKGGGHGRVYPDIEKIWRERRARRTRLLDLLHPNRIASAQPKRQLGTSSPLAKRLRRDFSMSRTSHANLGQRRGGSYSPSCVLDASTRKEAENASHMSTSSEGVELREPGQPPPGRAERRLAGLPDVDYRVEWLARRLLRGAADHDLVLARVVLKARC